MDRLQRDVAEVSRQQISNKRLVIRVGYFNYRIFLIRPISFRCHVSPVKVRCGRHVKTALGVGIGLMMGVVGQIDFRTLNGLMCNSVNNTAAEFPGTKCIMRNREAASEHDKRKRQREHKNGVQRSSAHRRMFNICVRYFKVPVAPACAMRWRPLLQPFVDKRIEIVHHHTVPNDASHED